MSNFISKAWGRYRKQSGMAREFTTLILAAAFGVAILPALIWVGGHFVLGDYVRDPLTGQTGGPVALWLDYLHGLAQGSPGNWLACSGLYVIYLLLKLLRHLLKL